MPATAWIELNDFSPGIYSDIQSNGTNQTGIIKDGAATVDNTYRCCADMAGQLVPLPALVNNGSLIVTPDSTHTTTANRPASPMGDQFLLDGVAIGTVATTGFDPNSNEFFSGGLFLIYGLYYNNAGTGVAGGYSYYTRLMLDGSLILTGGSQMGLAKQVAAVGDGHPGSIEEIGNRVPGGMLARVMSSDDATTVPVPVASMLNRIAGVYSTLIGTENSGAIPAADGTAGLNNAAGVTGGNVFLPNGGSGNVFMFPSSAVPNNNSLNNGGALIASSTLFRLNWCIGHQGRTVVAGTIQTSFGTITTIAAELLAYMTPNKIFSTAATGVLSSATRALYVEENQSGIGCLGSINSSELLVIKQSGGGAIVRGDLDNPTVIRLPSLQSTYGLTAVGTNSPIGFVYATRNGIYAWAGKDTATNLSNNLNPEFWDPNPTVNFQGPRGRLAWWDPWIMCPNDYVYDTTNSSWWRLDNPTIPHSHFDVDPFTGKLFAMFSRIPASSSTAYSHQLSDSGVLATSYSWQSQPLATSTQKYLEIDEIELIAFPATGTALSTVVITLTGIDENGNQVFSAPTPFSLTNSTGKMQILHEKVRRQAGTGQFRARYLQMTIAANSNASQAAPKIHSVRIGYQEVQTSQTVNR